MLPLSARRAAAMKLYGSALKVTLSKNLEGTPVRINDEKHIEVKLLIIVLKTVLSCRY